MNPHYTLKSMRMRAPTTLGLCCLLQCTVIKDKNWHCLLPASRYFNERPKKNQRQGYMPPCKHTTNEEPMNNKKAKEFKAKRQEVENTKSTKCKKVWKIYEVVRGQGPISWNWGVPHVKSGWEKSFRRFPKLVEHFNNIDWKAHELACNLHEYEFALTWSHLTKGVLQYLETCFLKYTITQILHNLVTSIWEIVYLYS